MTAELIPFVATPDPIPYRFVAGRVLTFPRRQRCVADGSAEARSVHHVGLDLRRFVDTWREIIQRPNAAGSLMFTALKPPLWSDPRSWSDKEDCIVFAFHLVQTDEKFSEFAIQGMGVNQLIPVRRWMNTRIQWGFYCVACNRLQRREFVFYLGGDTSRFLCYKCPEALRNWERWRGGPASVELKDLKDLKDLHRHGRFYTIEAMDVESQPVNGGAA